MKAARAAVLLLMLLPWFGAACAGAKVRAEVLPVMADVFERIVPDIERGMVSRGLDVPATEAVTRAVAAFREGLRDGKLLAALDWTPLRELAVAGVLARVQAEEIGPGVGASLLERVRLFTESMEMIRR